jgi:hypothetical protein
VCVGVDASEGGVSRDGLFELSSNAIGRNRCWSSLWILRWCGGERHDGFSFLRVGVEELRRQPFVLDIRLAARWMCQYIEGRIDQGGNTHASSKPLIASLIPSVPEASVP